MFKFFVLSNSGSGEARRHFPFRSIIHKHALPFFFALVVLLFSSVPVSVHALADPVMQPVFDTQFYQLPQTFNGLTGPQQDIFYFVLGNNLISYAGLSDYEIENPYSDPDDLGDWIKKLGYDLYNDVIESFSIAGAPIISAYKFSKELFGNIVGAMNFAGAFNNSSWQDFYTDVQTNGLDLQLYPSMFGALNQYFAQFGGLFEWQSFEVPFDNNFSWVINDNITGSNLTNYLNYYSLLSSPVQVNSFAQSSYYKNFYVSDSRFDTLFSYPNLFFDTSSGRAYFVNDSGEALGQYSFKPSSYLYYLVIGDTVQYSDSNNLWSFQVRAYYSFNTSGSISSSVNSFLSDPKNMFYSSGNYYVYPSLFWMRDIFYGPSWSARQQYRNIQDLNFGESDSNNYLSPSEELLLDIKGLLQDLLEQNDLRAPVLDNLSNPDGTPVTVHQLQPVSVALDLPDSGIDIPTNIFGGFFNSSDGFISYLWYMTKPLVVYTHDLLDCFWFGPEAGFDWSGPAPIVFGVISLGLIGGLIVKMLL